MFLFTNFLSIIILDITSGKLKVYIFQMLLSVFITYTSNLDIQTYSLVYDPSTHHPLSNTLFYFVVVNYSCPHPTPITLPCPLPHPRSSSLVGILYWVHLSGHFMSLSK